MQEINEKNIVFFEVEKEDREKVIGMFPEATIYQQPFGKKFIRKLKRAEILCGMIYSDFSGELLAKCPNLKMVAVRTVGYNQVDLKWCKKNNIPVSNVPDYGSHVIAEHAFALLLASVRNVVGGVKRIERNQFVWPGLRGTALKGKTMGVIGTGKIGQHVCRIASKGFLMNVIAYDVCQNKNSAKTNGFKYVKLDEIWKNSDIISLHIPLYPETKHLINEKTINKMRDGVIIINTARGGLIDSRALIRGAKSGKIARAALDVIENEENIRKNKKILHTKNILITPHIAFYADDSMDLMFSEAISSIKQFMAGKKILHEVKR
ncbi:MAG: NAD(P)-dependent oxidoreductase [Patescibacteria group bacterium]|jgi:D-lactate dehydrogenase